MTIPLDRFSNSALTTLAAGMDNVTNPATMVVASAVGFPTAGSFRVLVGTELMQVTAGAGTTSWTVNRAVENTTIAAHIITDSVVHVVTAFEMNSMIQTYNVVAYGAVGNGVTDDTAKIQLAVNDAHAAANGGQVILPMGLSFKLNSNLTTYSNVSFLNFGSVLSGTGANSVAPMVNLDNQGNIVARSITVVSGSPYAPSALAYPGGEVWGTKQVLAPPPGGVDDTTVLAALIAGGNVDVALQPGSYRISSQLVLASNTRLRGAGAGTTIFLINATNAHLLAIGDGTHDVTVQDLILDGNRANQTSNSHGIIATNNTSTVTKNLTFLNITAIRCYLNGFVVRGQNILFDNCRAEDCGTLGFDIAYGFSDGTNPTTGFITRDVRVVGCTAKLNNQNAQAHGFAVSGPAKLAWGTLVQDVTFVGCHAEQNGINGTAGGGGFRAVSLTLAGAEVLPNTNPAGIRNVTFDGCTAYANADGGFWLAGVTGGIVSGCTVNGNSAGSGFLQKGAGIELQACSHSMIIGCTVYQVGAMGYRIRGGDAATFAFGPSAGNTLVGCMADSCGTGDFTATKQAQVLITWLNDLYPLLGSRLHDCTIRSGQLAGIQIISASDWQITACTIEDNGQAASAGNQQGIVLSGANAGITTNALSNGLVVGNVIRDTRAGGARTQLFGIQDNSVNVDSNHYVANLIYNHATADLSLSGTLNVFIDTDPTGNVTLANKANLILTDDGTGSANLKLLSNGTSKWLRNSGNILQFLNSAYSLVIAQLDNTGHFETTAHLYPGPEALGALQTSGGFLHAVAVPSNANGNNNDNVISDNGHRYFKAGGVWNDNWLNTVQAPTEAVLVSGVDMNLGAIIKPVALTAARAVGAPLNPLSGQRCTFTIVQDGTGGRAVTWNAVFKVTWADTGNTLNKRSSISFIYDGTNWNQDGAQTPYV